MPPRLIPASCGALRTPQLPFSAISRALSSSASSAFAPPRDHSPSKSHHHPSTSSSSHSHGHASNSSSSLFSVGQDHRHSRPGHGASPPPTNRGEAAARLLNRYRGRAETIQRNKQAQLEFLKEQKNSNDYLKQMPRFWDAGDVYSPHDLSPIEMNKWRKRSQRKNDVVDALGIKPLDMYKNFSLIQEFTTSSGQIVHSTGTRLRPVNQRKIAKMIRRVQGMGIYPTIHDHPEMIRDEFFPPQRNN